MLRDAKRDLNRALKHSPKDYQVMYFRGILNFSLHYFYDAITDFETVIEKSEETNAKYYLARGRCYACLSMFKEAITDLSIAINLNKDLLDVSQALITMIVGLSKQRKVCIPDRRYRARLHGLPEADRTRAGKLHISYS
jgi:tetratricopeptide (TPR) repeat protein